MNEYSIINYFIFKFEFVFWAFLANSLENKVHSTGNKGVYK